MGYQILAALLHMGNIKYKGKVVDNLDATDIPDTSNVERVAAILGVQKQSLGMGDIGYYIVGGFGSGLSPGSG